MTFDSIDCEHLTLMQPNNCWVCMEYFWELRHVSTCIECKDVKMSEHIKFDGFYCKYLKYVEQGNTWVCIDKCIELIDVDYCFRCKFARQLKREELIRKGVLNGAIL